MQSKLATEADLSRLSALIAGAMGLNFPPERWPELARAMVGAAEEFGFDDLGACAEWLLGAPLTKSKLKVLAGHLTIGETYFFRENKTFERLAQNLLPPLIQARRGRDQRLRFWSAGCCTGEEAYSLAIMVQQLLPDLVDWRVTILATDINPDFLRKAVAGSYREWSFRNPTNGFKDRYFTRTTDGSYVVLPAIKEMVTFEHLNLVEDCYPSLATNTNAMDVIFCRNVLMYFTSAQVRKVIGNFHHTLLNGGCLAVSPSEASRDLFPQFTPMNFPGVILFQKDIVKSPGEDATPSVAPGKRVVDCSAHAKPATGKAGNLRHDNPPAESPARLAAKPPLSADSGRVALAKAVAAYEVGRYAEAEELLRPWANSHVGGAPVFSLLARTLANQGKLAEAFGWCERWVAADKVDAAGYYVRAVVLLEQGDTAQARHSLQRAIYLQPGFVLAHFTLGHLARSGGRDEEAEIHFRNAMRLLARIPPADPLPESDGLTAGRLTETITAITALEASR